MILNLLSATTHDRRTFRTLFVFGPLVMCSIVPSVLFGIIFNEWGSNLIWGSVFGIGWCLSAFWSGNLVHDDFSTNVGLVWGWLLLLPLYFGSGWLWDASSERRRRIAALLLLTSFLFDLPASTIMELDKAGMHFPDYTVHLATSY